jgi:hypothetical protein
MSATATHHFTPMLFFLQCNLSLHNPDDSDQDMPGSSWDSGHFHSRASPSNAINMRSYVQCRGWLAASHSAGPGRPGLACRLGPGRLGDVYKNQRVALISVNSRKCTKYEYWWSCHHVFVSFNWKIYFGKISQITTVFILTNVFVNMFINFTINRS